MCVCVKSTEKNNTDRKLSGENCFNLVRKFCFHVGVHRSTQKPDWEHLFLGPFRVKLKMALMMMLGELYFLPLCTHKDEEMLDRGSPENLWYCFQIPETKAEYKVLEHHQSSPNTFFSAIIHNYFQSWLSNQIILLW